MVKGGAIDKLREEWDGLIEANFFIALRLFLGICATQNNKKLSTVKPEDRLHASPPFKS